MRRRHAVPGAHVTRDLNERPAMVGMRRHEKFRLDQVAYSVADEVKIDLDWLHRFS
jgi:hypothetical protein